MVSARIWTGSKGPISWALLTFSRYAWPRPRSHATGRSPHSGRPFRAEWLVHYFVIFGHETGAAPVSMIPTDPHVTAVDQTSGLVRLLLQPHKAITLEPQHMSSILFGFHIVGIELGNRSLGPHQHPGHSTVWLRARDGVEFSLLAFLPTGGRSTSGPASLNRDAGERVLRLRSCPAPRSLVVCQCWAVSCLRCFSGLRVPPCRGAICEALPRC